MTENVIPMQPGAEIVTLKCQTRLDLPPERILASALAADLEGVVIVGYTKAGEEYFASSYADAGDACWHLQRGIYKLNQTFDRIVEEGLPA